MPTGTHNNNPFAPRGTISREQLLAYVEGRLTAAEQHRVELHLESDPLLREAEEGLRYADTTSELRRLDEARPRVDGSAAGWWFSGALLLLLATAIGWWSRNDNVQEQERSSLVEPNTSQPASPTTEQPLVATEIANAVEQPAAMHIGHEPRALHTFAVSVEREPALERVAPRPTSVQRSGGGTSPRPLKNAKASLQLLFLHDLKLVHPKELYANDPLMRLADAHVAARFQDVHGRDSVQSQDIRIAYTRFMDEALQRFVSNDHKGCLDDLRFLLDQYPDDVNALFYGGLCAYDIGLYERALNLLHRAATHRIDVFDEEASWYHALTLERLARTSEARTAYGAIARSGGFYAEPAQQRATMLDGKP